MKTIASGLVLVVLAAGRAHAEPIVLDSGSGVSINLPGFPGDWDVRASGFRLVGTLFGPIFGMPCPCDPGTVLSMNHRSELFGRGDVTLGDQSLTGVDLEARLNVRSPTMVTLPHDIAPRHGVAFAFEFLLTGDFIGRRNGSVVFRQRLLGSGRFGVGNFHRNVPPDGAQFSPVAHYYHFEPFTNPTPVPEPISMLLVGTGLGALAFLRRGLP